MSRGLDSPLRSDRKGHVGNVVALAGRSSRAAHPSMQPPYDGSADPLPLAPLEPYQRQLMASLIRRWAAGAPMIGGDVDEVVRQLMGAGDGGAA